MKLRAFDQFAYATQAICKISGHAAQLFRSMEAIPLALASAGKASFLVWLAGNEHWDPMLHADLNASADWQAQPRVMQSTEHHPLAPALQTSVSDEAYKLGSTASLADRSAPTNSAPTSLDTGNHLDSAVDSAPAWLIRQLRRAWTQATTWILQWILQAWLIRQLRRARTQATTWSLQPAWLIRQLRQAWHQQEATAAYTMRIRRM
ncbi:unnamed protein product [Effrenium voratum]|nr:unnamed protein product [Effrenium voratum]